MDVGATIGMVGVGAAFVAVTVLAARHPRLALPLVFACAARVGLLIAEYYGMFVVPGSTLDAVRFYRIAVELSVSPWSEIFARIDPSNSYVYSALGAILFKLTAPSELLLKSTSLVLGVFVVYLAYRLAGELWDNRAARWAAWITAIYPFAAFNSVVMLREEVAIFCFLLGMLATVRWVRSQSPVMLTIALVGFVGATMFHGGWVAAIVGLFVVVMRETVSGAAREVGVERWVARYGSVVIVGIFAVVAVSSQITLSSEVGDPVQQITGDAIESIEEGFSGETYGGSAYPLWIAQGDPLGQPWLIPARIGYFLFSPFPWDIREARHLLGIIGTLMFGWLATRIWRNRRTIVMRRDQQAVLLICACVIFVFAIGTTNIGTSLRHRTKIFVALVAVAAGAARNRGRVS